MRRIPYPFGHDIEFDRPVEQQSAEALEQWKSDWTGFALGSQFFRIEDEKNGDFKNSFEHALRSYARDADRTDWQHHVRTNARAFVTVSRLVASFESTPWWPFRRFSTIARELERGLFVGALAIYRAAFNRSARPQSDRRSPLAGRGRGRQTPQDRRL